MRMNTDASRPTQPSSELAVQPLYKVVGANSNMLETARCEEHVRTYFAPSPSPSLSKKVLRSGLSAKKKAAFYERVQKRRQH